MRKPVRRASIFGAVWLVVAALAPFALGKEKSKDLVALAAQQAKDGKLDEAAASYGKAASLAQGERDLDAEQLAVDGLEELIGKTKAGEARQRALGAAAKALDAKRAGGLVAARGLALGILLESTVSGSPTGVAEAAEALAATSKVGQAGTLIAAYGAGMKLAAEGKSEEAAAALEAVSDKAFADRFDDLAFFAAVEAGAARLALKDAKAAKDDFARAARVFADGKDAWMSNAWRRAAGGRFADDPADSMQPLTEALGGGTSASAAGGKGGRGGAGASADGIEDVSPVGRAIRTAGKKPVAWMKRTAKGWESGEAWSAEAPERHAYQDGFRVLENGSGLYWIVSGRSHTVTVRKIDRTGLLGGPGESSEPPLVRPRWHVAEGESLKLVADGTILVSK